MHTIILLSVFVILWLGINRKRESPRVFYWRYTFNYNGFIIPMVGIIINKKLKTHNDLQHLIDHENIHWQQFKKYTLIPFLFLYIYEIIRYGYDLAPMEIEARQNETPWVRINYTWAVRNHIAKTPGNIYFRKGKRTTGGTVQYYEIPKAAHKFFPKEYLER